MLKHKNRISVIEKILKLGKLNKVYGSVYITSQMYLNNWDQKNFKEFQKKFSQIFSILNAKKLTKKKNRSKKHFFQSFFLTIRKKNLPKKALFEKI